MSEILRVLEPSFCFSNKYNLLVLKCLKPLSYKYRKIYCMIRSVLINLGYTT